MSLYKLNTKLTFLIIVGLVAAPFAQAAFKTATTGKGKYDGTTVSTITSTCVTNGFPTDGTGATLCQEVTDGTYDADCVNWGLDQSPVVSLSACSGLTHTQYTTFKTALGQATLSITNGGNGFTSYTEQKSYFDTFLTNTKAIYANQLGYSASSDHNTTFEAAVSAVANMQTQCSSSTTSPLTTCSASISNCACIPKSEYDDIASGAVAIAAALDAADNTPHTLTKALIDDIVNLDTSSIDLTDSNVIGYLAEQFSTLDSTTTTQPSQLTSYVTGATATNVALWKIGKMVSDSTNHPSSGLTIALLEDAGMTSGADTTVGASLAVLKTNISTSGLTATSSSTAINNWVTEAAGFADGTTYASVATATGNGWTSANYKASLNVASTDWTTSSADATLFAACEADMPTCNYTKAYWNSTLKIIPTFAATTLSFLQGASLSYDLTSKITNKPGGISFANIATGFSINSSSDVIAGTLSSSGTSQAITFRIQNALNTAKSLNVTLNVTLGGNTFAEGRCYTTSSSGNEDQCQSQCSGLGSGWTCAREASTSSTSHPITEATCGANVNGNTRWIIWDNADPNDNKYRKDQYYGYNDTWDGLVENCPSGPGSTNSCSNTNTFVCARYTN